MNRKNITRIGGVAAVIAMVVTALLLPSQSGIPVQQVVVYRPQAVAYDNFSAAILAQGQISEAAKLPNGADVSFYIDANKVGGPSGITSPGVRCSSRQASASYYRNTISMDGRFCSDFNDAILDKRAVYGMVPDESVFIHNSSGERCYVSGWGGGIYMINPMSEFYQNYVVKRGSEKLEEYNLDILFLDDIQPGANNMNCGGSSKEYPSYSDYANALIEMAYYVKEHMPAYKVEANPANASSEWDKMYFLDGIMVENFLTDWGNAYPSASRMLADVKIVDKWIKADKKIYIVSQPPNVSDSSNRFIFAAALLVARGNKVYFHFGGDYDNFYPLPEYKYVLGEPLADYSCSGNICMRMFQKGTVRVDFAARVGSVILGESTSTPITSTYTSASPFTQTPTRTATKTPTRTPTATRTGAGPTNTPTQTIVPTLTPDICPLGDPEYKTYGLCIFWIP